MVIRCGSIFRKLGGENALLKYREESESRLKKFIKNVINYNNIIRVKNFLGREWYYEK